MTCQDAIDVMGDALEGRLTAELRLGFDEHMAECPPCATYLQHLQVTRETLLRLGASKGATSARRQQLIEAFRREFGGK